MHVRVEARLQRLEYPVLDIGRCWIQTQHVAPNVPLAHVVRALA